MLEGFILREVLPKSLVRFVVNNSLAEFLYNIYYIKYYIKYLKFNVCIYEPKGSYFYPLCLYKLFKILLNLSTVWSASAFFENTLILHLILFSSKS